MFCRTNFAPHGSEVLTYDHNAVEFMWTNQVGDELYNQILYHNILQFLNANGNSLYHNMHSCSVLFFFYLLETFRKLRHQIKRIFEPLVHLR